jgi:hypothetical protein
VDEDVCTDAENCALYMTNYTRPSLSQVIADLPPASSSSYSASSSSSSSASSYSASIPIPTSVSADDSSSLTPFRFTNGPQQSSSILSSSPPSLSSSSSSSHVDASFDDPFSQYKAPERTSRSSSSLSSNDSSRSTVVLDESPFHRLFPPPPSSSSLSSDYSSSSSTISLGDEAMDKVTDGSRSGFMKMVANFMIVRKLELLEVISFTL